MLGVATRAWYALRRRSPLFRKGTALLKQVPRTLRGAAGTGPGYFVVANSVPKSGTHLLVQILAALPQVRDYETFIASVPPVRFRERSQREIDRRIRRIVGGELVSAHLHWNATTATALAGRGGAVHYFIYRDPRDVAVSEAHYLTHMTRWHRAHRYFARTLGSDDDRLMAAIRGIPAGEVPWEFPDIGTRVGRYLGWLDDPDVFPVRFEELRSDDLPRVVAAMVTHFVERTGYRGDETPLVRRGLASIAPERSRTFRSGQAGGWQAAFRSEHAAAMKAVAGDLLIRLGYARDHDW